MKSPVILLRNAWQTENIGDIAHTPGALALIEKHIPEANVILWAGAVDRGVDSLLRNRFKNLIGIVQGKADSPSLTSAFAQADFLLHGSGSGFVAMADVSDWVRATGKPFGLLGNTITNTWPELVELLNRATFIFTRETRSIELLQEAKVSAPFAFGPDAAFACDLRDDAGAQAWLSSLGVSGQPFLCVVPRLRITPYHHFRQDIGWSAERIAEVERINAATAEPDHKVLRDAIVTWVERTGLPVLLVPEMAYILNYLDALILDKLPPLVRSKVFARRTYWLPDEAASVYRQAAAVLSIEMHSPILSLRQGTPAAYLRQPTDTHKGQMWRDIGFPDLIFEIEETNGQAIGQALVSAHERSAITRQRVKTAMAYVDLLHEKAMGLLRRSLPL